MTGAKREDAREKLLAGGLGARADVGLAVGVAGHQRTQHAGVGRLPLGVEEDELVEPHDGGESDEAVVVVQQREKRVHEGVHHHRIHLAALDLREEGGEHVVGFLRVRGGGRGHDADLAVLVAEEEEETVDQLRKVLEHVHAGLVVQHLRVREGARGDRDPGDHQTTNARVVHR